MFRDIDVKLDDFMLHCESKMLSRKTMASYEQSVRLFAHYLEDVKGVTNAKDVKTEHIRAYIKYLRERGKYTVVSEEFTREANSPQNRPDIGKEISDATIGNYVRNLKVFFRYLKEEREIKTNPAKPIENIKPSRKKKQLLSEQELKALMRSFDITSFYGYRSYTITRLLLDTGMRIGECLDLVPDDIDFKNKAIHVRNPKNKKERFVFFSPKLKQELRRWVYYRDRYCDSELLFPTNRGTKLTPSSYEKTLRGIGRQLGVDITPHQLRNNFAKYYLLNGGDIISLSRILGHSNAETTKVYLDFDEGELGQKYQRHSPMDKLNI
ncbi:tyrosine-type recombinase/integrase [Salicibibacter kimchii]|uniref:tyrosine-type recombinase/integrase n=1 Tax=Salicibibacter kimchii TaxID=2099786 RepID=UPI001D039956|nr:tyrosine-type recombinase/integrase [Salicibibacter kimchii]